MYLNDVHILYYVFVGLLGLVIGQFVDWCNLRLPEYKKVFSKEFFTIYLKNWKPKYILSFTTAILYIVLLYVIGWQNNVLYQMELVKYMLLIPMLLSAVVIDWKYQIIPNRLNLTIFEVGLVFTFMQGAYNINLAMNLLLGSIVGAGIFLVITLLGGMIAGKEAMGFGDVKLMGALGLYFGLSNIIVVTLLSFLIGAILSIILLATKIKKIDEYIPFGPFIVIGTFISIFVPFETIKNTLLMIFTLGLYAK